MKMLLMLLTCVVLAAIVSIGLNLFGAPSWLVIVSGIPVGVFVGSWHCWYDY